MNLLFICYSYPGTPKYATVPSVSKVQESQSSVLSLGNMQSSYRALWTSRQEQPVPPDSTQKPVEPRLTGRRQNVLRRHFVILRSRLLHWINLIISLFAASSCRYGSYLKLQKWQKADNFKISNVYKYWNEQHVSWLSGLKMQDSNFQLNRPQLQSSAFYFALGLWAHFRQLLSASSIPIISFPQGKQF